MEQCIEKAKEDEGTEVLRFDFKQNVLCPQLSTTDMFYKRQLRLYVMSVYFGKSGESIMYT